MKNKQTSDKSRLVSLDFFRGLTIILMIVVNLGILHYSFLMHSEWDGLTLADTVFPSFLWIMGVSMVFSFNKRIKNGADKKTLFLHMLRRSIILFCIGLFVNFISHPFLSSIRIPGVLQRIAICYLFAGIILLNTRWKGQVVWTALLLVLYFFLMKFVPVPGYGAGVLTLEGNLAGYLDRSLLEGNLIGDSGDPEGILSTIPAVATVLFGILTGHLLLSKSIKKKVSFMLFGSLLLIFLGLVWAIWFPLNKALWTSSYVVLTTGLTLIIFSVSYWIIDIKGYKKWSFPFILFGLNAITIYIISILVNAFFDRVGGKYLFFHRIAYMLDYWVSSLIFVIICLIFFYLIVYFLYRKRWFLKI